MSDGTPRRMTRLVLAGVVVAASAGCTAQAPSSAGPVAVSLQPAPTTAAPSPDQVNSPEPAVLVLDPTCIYDGDPLDGIERVNAWLSDPPIDEEGKTPPVTREVIVPDLTGMDFETAWPYLCTLAEYGMYFYADPLDVTADGTIAVAEETFGTVESQMPSPGVIVPVGARQLLALRIAAPRNGDDLIGTPPDAPATVVVPDVADLRPSDARVLLELSGLVRGEIRDDPIEDADGRVLRTIPGAGETVELGTVIDLVL